MSRGLVLHKNETKRRVTHRALKQNIHDGVKKSCSVIFRHIFIVQLATATVSSRGFKHSHCLPTPWIDNVDDCERVQGTWIFKTIHLYFFIHNEKCCKRNSFFHFSTWCKERFSCWRVFFCLQATSNHNSHSWTFFLL